jgi:hypothetical protein
MPELVKVRRSCRLCGSPRLVRSIPLAEVPIVSPNVGTAVHAGHKMARIVAPLDNYLCEDCGLIQLIHVVDPGLIYSNYLYRTAVSAGLSEHFHGLSRAVSSRLNLKANDLVVEFGSNDGTLLAHFKAQGFRVQGVDPAVEIASAASARGIPTRIHSFDVEIARAIRADLGPARAVLSNNTMANVDNLTEILAGVKSVMAPDGAFVFETQYALDVMEKTLLDVIYHEHITTFSIQPVVRAFEQHGLKVFDATRIPTKGGSIRFWVQHEGGPQPVSPKIGELIALEQKTGLYDVAYHARFSKKIARIKDRLHSLIDNAKTGSGLIAAYGTSVGCVALIHQFELQDKLDMIFDDAPFKTRMQGPGYDLPVYKGETVGEYGPRLIIILAWRYAEAIRAKRHAYVAGGGRFVVPLPEVSELR